MISSVSDSLDFLFNAIGILGMMAILFAYFMQQAEKWASAAPAYLYTNIIGASLLMASLLWSWNLPSFLLECAWLSISGYGLVKYYRRRQHGNAP